jgi:hypothetical protein
MPERFTPPGVRVDVPRRPAAGRSEDPHAERHEHLAHLDRIPGVVQFVAVDPDPAVAAG